jgi:hypothetical protein
MGQANSFVTVRGFGDRLDVAHVGQQASKPRPYDFVVVGDEQSDRHRQKRGSAFVQERRGACRPGGEMRRRMDGSVRRFRSHMKDGEDRRTAARVHAHGRLVILQSARLSADAHDSSFAVMSNLKPNVPGKLRFLVGFNRCLYGATDGVASGLLAKSALGAVKPV